VVVVGVAPITAGVQIVVTLNFSSVRVPKPSPISSAAGALPVHFTR
jgi:hypothetical protein